MENSKDVMHYQRLVLKDSQIERPLLHSRELCKIHLDEFIKILASENTLRVLVNIGHHYAITDDNGVVLGRWVPSHYKEDYEGN